MSSPRARAPLWLAAATSTSILAPSSGSASAPAPGPMARTQPRRAGSAIVTHLGRISKRRPAAAELEQALDRLGPGLRFERDDDEMLGGEIGGIADHRRLAESPDQRHQPLEAGRSGRQRMAPAVAPGAGLAAESEQKKQGREGGEAGGDQPDHEPAAERRSGAQPRHPSAKAKRS